MQFREESFLAVSRWLTKRTYSSHRGGAAVPSWSVAIYSMVAEELAAERAIIIALGT